jgi:beta-glucosidase
VPTCASHKLLTSILRKEWGFKGYVISDEGALENIIFWHKYLTSAVDTAAACIKAGCNIELSANNPVIYDAISKLFIASGKSLTCLSVTSLQ